MLAGKEEDQALAARLERISGLSVTDLRVLHEGPVWSSSMDMSTQSGLLAHVTVSDPHQVRIRARTSPDGDEVLDRVSGR